MDQAVAKNHEEIKKARKDIRRLGQSIEIVRQSIDGVHQTVTAGLQRIISDIEKLNIENIKIKSNLKYLMSVKSSSSGDTNFFSDSEMQTSRWLSSSSSSSLRYPQGSQLFNPASFRNPQFDTKFSDLSSDDTDDDRDTIITDSVEEDTRPRQRKEKRKTNTSSQRSENLRNLTSEITSSSSDISNDQSLRGKTNVMSNHNNVSQNNKPGTSVTASSTVPNDVTETDRNSEPVSTTVSKGGATGSSGDMGMENDVDLGEESEEDTNITMEEKPKVSMIYPHTVPDYKPVMVDYDQIDFSNGVDYVKSLGFVIIDPNNREFLHKICALDNRKNEQLPKGLYTLLLLDTSYSIGPGGLYEMKKFVNEFLDEIEMATEHNLEEMVAVMEFGCHAGVLHEFTNDYSLIREALEKVDICGGRTHLWSALIGVLAFCHKRAKSCVINGKKHGVRIVMVCDGNVTDEVSVLSDCENEADLERIEERILKFMPYLLREKMTLSGVEIGMDSEARFMKKFAKKGKGQYGLALWAKFVGRYYLYQSIIGKMLPELKDPKNQGKVKDLIKKHTEKFDYFDKTDVAEISLLLQDRYKIEVPEELFERVPLPEYDDDFRITLYSTNTSPRLPPIGSRVETSGKFKDRHRGYKIGTVVAHCLRNTMVVKWDEEPVKIHCYRYETENHEVEEIEGYRQIDLTKPGLIETGCRVIRGIDWNRGEEDGGSGTLGVVVRKHAQKWVTVKWPNGKKLRYRFGAEDCYDLEIVDEEKRKKLGIPEKLPAYQFKEDNTTEWRTLEEGTNIAVINYVDSMIGGYFTVVHLQEIYSFNIEEKRYFKAEDESIKGEVRLIEATADELKALRKKEGEKFVEQQRNISPQVVQAHKMDVLSQITGGGGGAGPMGRGQSVPKRGGKVVRYGFSSLGQGGFGPANQADSGFGKPNIQPGQSGLGQPNIGQGGFSQTNMGLGGSGFEQLSSGQGGFKQTNMGLGGSGQPNIPVGQAGFGQPNIGQGGFNPPNMGQGGEKWNCSQCTFENQSQSTQCEMCKSARLS